MPSWQGKSRGSKLGYSIFVKVIKTFGILPAYALLRIVAFYYFFFSRRSSKPVIALYRKKLGYTYGRSLILLYRNYYRFGQSLIDKVVLLAGIRNNFSFEFEGEERLYEMVKMKQGGLLLSAHIGNWDIAGHLLRRLGTRINIVMFDGEESSIKEYLEKESGKSSANIIVIKNDLSHIYAIAEAFRKNELVCIHADRFVEGNKTTDIPFINEKALFPSGPFILASKFKVPVAFVFALKERRLHYHFFCSPLVLPGEKLNNPGNQPVMEKFVIEMENKLKQYPEQWFNYYDFWKH